MSEGSWASRILTASLLVTALAVAWVPCAFAQAGQAASQGANQGANRAANPLAFARAAHLRRGVNASIWFAQHPQDYSAQRLTTYITAEDFKTIHQLGCDHVRFSIDPAPLLQAPLTHGLNAEYLKLLDAAVKEILDSHLSVVLDIHPEGDYKHPLRNDADAQAAFVEFWNAFATHYASTDPERVYFEILNEPEVNDPQAWAKLQGRVVPVIRKAAPQHTIIATSAHYSGLRDLLVSQPVQDANVIYTFHDYEPFPFTHQGAGWTMAQVKPLSGIPYPSTAANIKPKLSQESTLADQLWLDEYGLSQWNAERIQEEVSYAHKWSEQYHVPVWCGEFGVFRDHSDAAMRTQWLHDMRVALEQNGIGWDMWDWRNNFGLATDVNGKRVADPDEVRALGLTPVE